MGVYSDGKQWLGAMGDSRFATTDPVGEMVEDKSHAITAAAVPVFTGWAAPSVLHAEKHCFQ